jgi:ferrous iron transport protein A
MDACVNWHVTGELCSLAALHKGARGVVSAVTSGDTAAVTMGDSAGSTITRRLLEVGFVPGEHIEVIAETQPGGDPIAVRIGSSIFALRRREAQAVLVQLERIEGL